MQTNNNNTITNSNNNKFYKVNKTINNNIDNIIDNNINVTPLPTRSTKHSAGYDIYLPYDIIIPANTTNPIIIHTGIGIELDEDKYLSIVVRSSIGIKRGLYFANGCSIIDADYAHNSNNDGEILIAVCNRTDEDIHLKQGERIAQGIIMKYYITNDDNCITERTGGVGSTGV